MNAQPLLDEPAPDSPATPAVPSELTSAQSKLVYLYLDCAGGATADDIAGSLGLKKISLYPVLDSLETRGVVRNDGNRYVTVA
jgi:DNA-binding MarR family transcriptional regulator